MSPITRKPVFGVCDQVRHKPACPATEASQSLEILDIASIDIILSKQRKTKALIRLRGCAGWSAPVLFVYSKNRFSHDVAQMMLYHQFWRIVIRNFSICFYLWGLWWNEFIWVFIYNKCDLWECATVNLSADLRHFFCTIIGCSIKKAATATPSLSSEI